MTLAQYNILGLKDVGEYKVTVFSSMPDQLKGCWIQITKLNSSHLSYIMAGYFNDDHPENTIIVSDYLPTQYPDMYATFNKNLRNERVYINPIYRKKGLLGAMAMIGRSIFYDYLNIIVDIPLDFSKKTEKAANLVKSLWQEEFEMVPVEKRSAISLFDMEPPRDPAYPDVWHGHRIGGKNE